MTGQILNNKQIDDLIKQGIIGFSGYDSAKLQIAQYPLSAMSISEVGPDHKAKEIFRFDESHKSFSFAPQKYYLIDILEEIRLPKGIIGRFIPSSSFIELGLSITAGKIEYPYGQNKERIRFGIFNCLTIETTIFNDYRIAYVEFFDLRGLANLEYQLTPYDKNIYIERTHDDWDGPNYERDNRE